MSCLSLFDPQIIWQRDKTENRPLSYRGMQKMCEQLIVNGIPYRILRLLGRGKGGYSYLAEQNGRLVVVKQIHHECLRQ